MRGEQPTRVVPSTADVLLEGEVRNVPGNSYDKHGSKNPIVSWLMREFHSGVVRAVQQLEPDSVLDVGCGEGRTTNVICQGLGLPAVGVDLEVSVVREAASRTLDANFAAASVFELPFPDGVFDVVVATEVLEHLGDPVGALGEMARVARKGVVVTVPHEPWWRIANVVRLKYLKRLGNTPGHVQHWNKASFEAELRSVFESAVVEPVGLWLLGALRV